MRLSGIYVEDVTLTENGVKSSYITAFLCGDTGTKEIVKGIYGPEAQGWICRNQIQGSNEPVPTLLHKVWGRNIFTVTVFSVHDGGESPIFDTHTDGNTVTVLYRNGTSETVTL